MKYIKEFKEYDKQYSVTIITSEGLLRHSDKSGIEQENWAGYHLAPDTLQNCEIKKRELEVIGRYNGETIKKVNVYPASAGMGTFEGVAYKDNKKPYAKKSWDPDKKVDFKHKIKNHVKSLDASTKEVGNDLEIICDGEMIAQVMFRDSYIGIKRPDDRFVDELKYSDLGKIRSKITSIIKNYK